ncbi:MAG: hypothetical protein AABX72_01360, partial [Nanoarchaeota archaeon]
MKDIGKIVAIIGQILFYILSAIAIYQVIKKLSGGSWSIEEVILTLLAINITMTLGLMGYLMYMNGSLNNKIAGVDKKLHGHIAWHKGKE